jgi:hypothetical protein
MEKKTFLIDFDAAQDSVQPRTSGMNSDLQIHSSLWRFNILSDPQVAWSPRFKNMFITLSDKLPAQAIGTMTRASLD